MRRKSQSPLARLGRFDESVRWAASAAVTVSSLFALACAAENVGEGDSTVLEDALLGECTTTSQCKNMYGAEAYDCSNSDGGVCLCNPGGVWCSSLDDSPGTGGGSSGGSCGSDGDCSGGEYCNYGQGGVCTPDRSDGSGCGRDAQCVSDSCVNRTCQASSEPPSDSCTGDAACPAQQYCNFNQGQICVDGRADGSHCTRDRQCLSGSCTNDSCSSSGGESDLRIAYSADGDYADSDDWGATAVALSMLGRAGGQDALEHFDYCSNPRSNYSQACAQSEESALGAQQRFGFDRSVFFNDDTELQASVTHLRDVVNASTAARPLYLIVAGPMDVAYRGLKAAQSSARRHVTLISHSTWNQNHTHNGSKRYIDIWNEGLVGYAIVRKNNNTPGNEDLPDQNGGFKKPESDWNWIKNSASGNWVFGRVQAVRNPGCGVNGISVCAQGDASDAGMMFYLLTGDKNGSVNELRNWWGL